MGEGAAVEEREVWVVVEAINGSDTKLKFVQRIPV